MMTSFHTNLAFDQEWAAPGEPSCVDTLSHAVLSCRAAFHESPPFAFSLPSNAQTVVVSHSILVGQGGFFFFAGWFSREMIGLYADLCQYEKRDDFCS